MGSSAVLRLGGAVVFAACVGLATSAHSDAIYSLNLGNTALSSYPGPYGAVDVALIDSTHATVTFTAYSSATPNGFLFGDSGVAAVNVNATSFSYSNFTASNDIAGFTPVFLNEGIGNVDGWGTFNLTFDLKDGYTQAANLISFTINDLSGTWANAESVLSLNGDGNLVAAHVFVCAVGGCDPKVEALATGYATSGVPGPLAGAGLPGLLAACGGLLLLSRWRRKASAA